MMSAPQHRLNSKLVHFVDEHYKVVTEQTFYCVIST